MRPADHRKEAHLLTSKPPDPSRLARWKEDMDPADNEIFESVAGRPAGRARLRGGEPMSSPWRSCASRASSAPPAPFVVGLTRSGTTLLRMMLDAHPQLDGAAGDALRARPDQGGEGGGRGRRVDARRADRATGPGATSGSPSRRCGSGCGAVRRRATPGPPCAAFFEAYAERQGKPRWGDKTPAYMLSVTRIGRALPEARFIHLIRDGRDVALSQTARAINEQPPPAEQAARWVKRIGKSREQAASSAASATSRPATRTSSATRSRRCGGSASSSSSTSTRAMLTYHERAAERLQEMAGALRQEGEHAEQEAGYRIDNHRPTTKPPDPSKLDKWRREMDAGRPRRLQRGRRRDAARARLRGDDVSGRSNRRTPGREAEDVRRMSASDELDGAASGSSRSGSTAARRSSPATSATRSTSAGTRPSSSRGRPRTRGRWRRTSIAPASGISPASPRPPTGRSPTRSTCAGSRRTRSTSCTGTTATSTTRSAACASPASRPSAASSGRCSAPRTRSRRRPPTTCSTR